MGSSSNQSRDESSFSPSLLSCLHSFTSCVLCLGFPSSPLPLTLSLLILQLFACRCICATQAIPCRVLLRFDHICAPFLIDSKADYARLCIKFPFKLDHNQKSHCVAHLITYVWISNSLCCVSVCVGFSFVDS